MSNKRYRSHIRTEDISIEEIVHPVDPVSFSDFVRDRILDLQPQFVFPDPMLESFRIMCSTFNEVTLRNMYDRQPARLLIPSPTGSGKSVSARAYLSLAERFGFSGILIVPKVSEAIDAVRDINKLAESEIATCTYSVSKDNPDSPERSDAENVAGYRVLVITHKMFSLRSQLDNKADMKNFSGSPRQCVIVDEKINFQETIAIATSTIKEMVFYVSDLPEWELIESVLLALSTMKRADDFRKIKLHRHIRSLRIGFFA